ncbi:hypothetical protein [Clostridium sp. ZS2-4]|uniref:hypothetical protein n=1 Tax=Clostridium sp. ZS2-4 TaxID=2987703 RepID=UPI00227D36D5|nr:hypothetical protein [Clostridium sp. ZS2-4]MCY6353672.1 hypothetical protein [Clostridium sp. ZS2-4]
MNYIFVIPPIILISFILYLIIIRVRKIKRQDTAIALTVRKYSYGSLILSILWFLIAFLSFIIFKKEFKQIYGLLVPKYISQWKDLFFHYDDLINLRNMFMKNEMYLEALNVSSYISNGLVQFYIGIIQALVGIVWLTRSFDKDSICKDGIYTNNRYYKWKNIKAYKWGELESKENRKEHLQYYCLEFEVYSLIAYSPIMKKVFNLNGINKIKMKISVNDKQKVEEFLKKNTVDG